MSIRMVTPESEIFAIIKEMERIVYDEMKKTLQYLGEQCVKRVRERGPLESWFDQTGNLRSSIGYAIYDHGLKVMESAFGAVLGGGVGSEEGKKYIRSLASDYSNVYALVVVAGMSYAEFVEKKESKDVLASTQLWAESVIKDYMNKTIARAELRINKLLK